MTEEPIKNSLKHNFNAKEEELRNILVKDIELPPFYDSYREFKSIELTQG